MARGINKVILVGNLGQDPELRYMPNGTAIANISLATSDTYKDKNTGQPVEKTEWHRVVFIGKLAEIVGEHCQKGAQIYVEGKLKTRKWTNQLGQDQYTTEVVIDQFNGAMQMLGGRAQHTQQHQPHYNQAQSNQPRPQRAPQSAPAMQSAAHSAHQNAPAMQNAPGYPVDFDDDIPFAPLGLSNKHLLHNC